MDSRLDRLRDDLNGDDNRNHASAILRDKGTVLPSAATVAQVADLNQARAPEEQSRKAAIDRRPRVVDWVSRVKEILTEWGVEIPPEPRFVVEPSVTDAIRATL